MSKTLKIFIFTIIAFFILVAIVNEWNGVRSVICKVDSGYRLSVSVGKNKDKLTTCEESINESKNKSLPPNGGASR